MAKRVRIKQKKERQDQLERLIADSADILNNKRFTQRRLRSIVLNTLLQSKHAYIKEFGEDAYNKFKESIDLPDIDEI